MKVFNWVHRRFLHVHSCPAYPQDNGLERCSVRLKSDAEKHALLEHGGHVQLVDVLDDWNDGILAIGTLAIGPLDTTNCTEIIHGDDHVENPLSVHDNHDHDHDQDTGDDDLIEASPLIKVALFSHELEKVEADEVDGSCKNEIEAVGDGVVVNLELKDKINDMIKDDCQIKRRVTLADLFSEDSDHHLVKKLKETDDAANNIIVIRNPSSLNMKPTAACHAKVNGFCKAKKFLKEELSPLRKLNQLMKRMMKKKIHPDLEGKMQKMKDMQMQPSNDLQVFPTNNRNDLASLLLIPDSMA